MLPRRADRAGAASDNPTPGAASTVSPQSASLPTCFQTAARVMPNARASSSPEWVRPSAKRVQQTFGRHAVYWPRRSQRAAGLANRDSVPSSMRRMLPRCA